MISSEFGWLLFSILKCFLGCSPGYADDNAYWVGATDSGLEGDFRWVDGLPFGFTSEYTSHVHCFMDEHVIFSARTNNLSSHKTTLLVGHVGFISRKHTLRH